MRATRTFLWLSLLGAPLAWTAQLVLGLGVEEADCSAGGAHWGLHAPAWNAGATIAGVAVGVAGTLAAVALLRRAPDPRGRTTFLAEAALLVNGLFLALILLGGIAALILDPCDR